MTFELFHILSGESPNVAVLERFIGERLAEAGIWDSTRTSDGIEQVRLIRHDPRRVSLVGRLWEIDQTLRSFWLEVERTDGDGIAWTLYFDVLGTARQVRNALLVHDATDEIEWRVTLTGMAEGRVGSEPPERD